jgi:hypothetical protein
MQFEELQAIHVADRDRLRLELAELGRVSDEPSAS